MENTSKKNYKKSQKVKYLQIKPESLIFNKKIKIVKVLYRKTIILKYKIFQKNHLNNTKIKMIKIYAFKIQKIKIIFYPRMDL